MSEPRKAGFGTKLAYGVGAAASGIKANGFDYFVLIFYSQVLGVSAPLVGLALMIALVFDAFSDPLVGYWSDNVKTRWGRRHPFMYVAAVPVALAYYFVWNPPQALTGNELFPYLVVISILVRTLITLYEVPSSALAAELTDDYDERTSYLSYRYFFAWMGGIFVAFFALRYLLTATEADPSGFFNVEGYNTYGLLAACMIGGAILISALGTHSHIPHLKPSPPPRKMTPLTIMREIAETVASRSFAALFVAAFFGFLASGIASSLNYYINGFFWEFTTDQTSLLTFSVFLSAFMALFISPIVSKTIGKKKGAIIVGAIAFTMTPAPVFLRLIGVMPDNGTDLLFGIIIVTSIIDTALIITTQTLMASMIADIVEESEVRTGRRSEGIFFAGISFIRKLVSGVGIMMATFILTLASFPDSAQPGQVSDEAVFRLGAWYAPCLFFIWVAMICSLMFYRINRDVHAENLETLRSRAAPEAD
ncbi:MFS transporter [Henriciella sp.]|uniref:MFS transporter n=1 Tax=Henriciella sp. TaxID=1968823 RepID=UPI0026342576|nr:MFS transporter [Henriciella sp.]